MEKRITILIILLLVVIAAIIILAKFDLVDWSSKINVGHILEILTLIILVFITAMYALSASEQANASVKMAEEMRYARYDTVRPVIDIQRDQWDEDKISEAIAASDGDTSSGLSCALHNIGLGPALDVYSFVKNPFSGGRQHHDFGTLATGEKTYKMNLSAKQADGRIALLAYYKDVYGRAFESSREVSVDKEKGWEIGPL